MRERVLGQAWSLVIFTVCAQAAAGVALVGSWFSGSEPGRTAPAIALVLLTLGGLVVLFHLGRPRRAALAMSNMRTSWLSREVLLGLAFGASLLAWVLLPHPPLRDMTALVAGGLGFFFVQAIAGVYRLRTVPVWDTWATPASFFGTMLVLGTSISALALSASGAGDRVRGLALIAACLALAVGVMTASAPFLRTTYRGVLRARSAAALLGAGLMLMVAISGDGSGSARTAFLAIATGLLVASELLGRFLFYASYRRVGL